LAQHLSTLGLDERAIMLIDTPAGNNVYLHQALSVADSVLVVVQPNAACLGTLDHWTRWWRLILSVSACHIATM
jgi:cellulose biosynthesis protein BcsQ